MKRSWIPAAFFWVAILPALFSLGCGTSDTSSAPGTLNSNDTDIVIGGIYLVDNGDGQFGVVKMLAFDDFAVRTPRCCVQPRSVGQSIHARRWLPSLRVVPHAEPWPDKEIMKPSEDAQHLRLLSIFHYVVAGMLGLISMFPIIHLTIGIAIVSGAFDDVENGTPPPAFFGWMFIIIPGVFILCGLTMAVCVAIAGRRLSQNRSYMYCLVMAGIECMFMPVGTVLGVFTIIVLMRPTVKERFGVAES